MHFTRAWTLCGIGGGQLFMSRARIKYMNAIAWYLTVVEWSVHCLNGKKRLINRSEKCTLINDNTLIRLHGDNIAAEIEISSNIGLDRDQDAIPILYLRFEDLLRPANILLFWII